MGCVQNCWWTIQQSIIEIAEEIGVAVEQKYNREVYEIQCSTEEQFSRPLLQNYWSNFIGI